MNMLGRHLHAPGRGRWNQLGGSEGGYVHHGHSRELARKRRKEVAARKSDEEPGGC